MGLHISAWSLAPLLLYQGRWVQLASEWNDSPMLDDKWGGWAIVDQKVEVVCTGPARGVLRHTVRRANKTTGKTASVVHDYSVFAGRSEIASTLTVVNTSLKQMVVLSRVVPGFYAVSPGGRYDPERDQYAGVNKKGELVTGSLKTTGFLVRRAAFRKAMWCDAYAVGEDRPRTGLGLIVERPLNSIYAICVADRPRRNKSKLRMSVYYIFRGNTLWPGRSYAVLHWYCAHSGDHRPVADFCELRNGIRIVPGDIEARSAD